MRAALAGNNLEGPVRLLLARVAAALGISAFELGAHRGGAAHPARHLPRRRLPAPHPTGTAQLEGAYRVLESTPAASDEEVVKAYRRQLQRHHPDKLKANGLPESMIEHAKQRTQQIIEAYELIRARRGLR